LQLPSTANPIGTPFIELQSVDSTNNYALSQIHANLAQPGTCYFAHEQTAGKGQRGKSWATEPGANITLSIVLTPGSLQIFRQFQLSACVVVATHNFLSNYADRHLRIKWPNDLYWKDKKLGGILIENVIRSRGSGIVSWDWAVIGIGININQTRFPAELPNPVSLRQITGKNFNTIQLGKELCQSVSTCYQKLMNEDFGSLLDTYNSFLYKKDKVVKLKQRNRIFETTIKGVSQMGELITQNSVEERFDFGGVEWMP
jgi:BirA family biotin operon repressor/biotin-[acetyl-CoA-carboxylase] ligase